MKTHWMCKWFGHPFPLDAQMLGSTMYGSCGRCKNLMVLDVALDYTEWIAVSQIPGVPVDKDIAEAFPEWAKAQQ